jgi:hypothetical protein
MAMLLEKMGIPPIFINYDSNAIKGQPHRPEVDRHEHAGGDQRAAAARGRQGHDRLLGAGARGQVAPSSPGHPPPERGHRALDPAAGLLGLTPDTNVGSQARSNVHFDVFMMVVERERKYAEIQLNRRVVRNLVDYNFAGLGNERPYLQLLPMTAEKQLELFKIWSAMVKDGTSPSRSRTRIPARDAAHAGDDRGDRRSAASRSSSKVAARR